MEINILEIGALIATLVLFGVLYFLKKKHIDFGVRTLIASAFGVIIGLIFKENFRYVAAFGTVYVNALQAFVVPLLLFSVISSITNLGNQVKLHKVGLKSVFFLLLNTFTAAVITLVAALSLGLGKGFEYAVEATEAKEVPTAVEAQRRRVRNCQLPYCLHLPSRCGHGLAPVGFHPPPPAHEDIFRIAHIR